ncbi:unknown protein [Paenibacillus amylolyticus]|uniref:Uncharacterized protein n=1 Tax=Paenibacillus amylolyticus TaxID=1451 RepID=A0A100VQA2_PAEAM|nr:unknown protein [Paenibacillus amylolyticus]
MSALFAFVRGISLEFGEMRSLGYIVGTNDAVKHLTYRIFRKTI